MLRKIFIFGFVILFLFSCGDDSINESTSSLVPFENDKFKMNIPSNWDIVKDYENSLPKPNVGDIELAVVSKNNILGFSNNLIILGTQLSKTITSKEYSMLNNVGAKTDYLEYTSLSSKEITFPGEDIGIVYEFEAKYNSDTQKLRFLQTARVCNEVNAYFITLALPADTKDTSRYIDFISSFSCK